MKSGAIILGTIVSLILLAAAGVLYLLADDGTDQHYRKSIDLVRQVQQISSDWSIEVTRVKSDPFADFDSLAAFIPRMASVKENLNGTTRLIPDPPDRLANDIHAYISAIEAKEESVERFKTGYAVVRNSSRYLPLAAVTASQQAQEVGDEGVMRKISTLVRDINLYLPTPTETAQARLTAELDSLRADSVAYSPALANALANLLSHAEVLVTKQGSTEELFKRATSNQISDLTNKLASSLEFELGKKSVTAKYYDIGTLAMLGTLALFWILLGVQQRVRMGVGAAPTAPGAAQVEIGALQPLPVNAGGPAVQPARAPAEISLASAEIHPRPADIANPVSQSATLPEVTRSLPSAVRPPLAYEYSEVVVVNGFIARCVADALIAAADQIGGRMDYLRQTHSRIQDALQNSNLIGDLYDGTEFDEGVDAISAIASSVHQDVAGISDLGKRLSSFSNSSVARDDIERSMIDINTCIEEALENTAAESVATVAKSLDDIPEIFALKSEFLLLLTKIIENSVSAVKELSGREGMIKIDTARKSDEIQITVIDNGDGIAPDRRTSIFKPFYTSRDGAMGIGLPLAGYLVKKYEGSIKINSLPGQGTVARITLPSGVPVP